MTFAMVVPWRPPSGSNRMFQERLRREAGGRYTGAAPLTGDLYVRVTWFHRNPTSQDVDNIFKSILDGLKKVVFADDGDVVQCLACKVYTGPGAGYSLDDRNAPDAVYEELVGFLDGEDHVLYIEIGPVPAIRVVFGPIDGGTV